MKLIEKYKNEFGELPEFSAKSFGRFEIIGNHTDHNHGLCLAATCNLHISCLLKPNNSNVINFISDGYTTVKLNLDELECRKSDAGSSIGIIRGMARYLKKHGYKIGGFNAVSKSNIFPGAGVSSSAAFESLIGQIFNVLFNDGKIDKLFLAKAGQYAENTDFGKHSGLLDQIGCGYGNISFIDFKDIDNPIVEEINYPFNDLKFVIVNTGGSHADLSDLYSSIPTDMINAAKKLGHNYLIECSEQDCPQLSEIERSRAKHFFGECERVRKAKEYINNHDKKGFLEMINESRKSSRDYLKNMMVGTNYKGSPLEATDIAMKILSNEGACKINGGGFAGSIICVVPSNKLDLFINKMSSIYSKKNVKEVKVKNSGPTLKKI